MKTDFRNFTCPQTYFGHPKPSGECQVTPLPIHPLIKIFTTVTGIHVDNATVEKNEYSAYI